MSKIKELKKSKPETEGSGIIYTALAVLVGLLVLAVIYFSFFVPKPAIDFGLLEGNAHFKGNPDAKVRIVEFSDFQCPACGAAFPNIERIFSEYSGRIKFTYRHFPLSTIHPFAQKAAEASECSAEQGKFWEMYEKLFQNQQSLAIDDLKSYAVSLGLDSAQFSQCLDSGKYASKVASDFSYGVSIGVNSTPTFYINGEKYSNLSYDQFKSVIDSKLA